MLNMGKILPENILTFTQDARKEKINCSSAEVYGSPLQNEHFENPFFFHVRKGPNVGIKSNFQGPTTSNG